MWKFAALASICLATVACSDRPRYPYQDARLGVDKRTEDLLRRMTDAEKADLVRSGAAGPGSARLGIPALKVDTTPPPSGLAWVATWNPDLVRQVAAQTKSAFGYYGEDPWLASRMTVAWTGAVQAAGRIGTLLDFPCGDAHGRQINEVRYPPFRAAIEEAGLWSVTSSCPDNPALRDWGFRGFAIGDQTLDDDHVRGILRAMFAEGLFDPEVTKADSADKQKVLRTVAEQSVVLLKNEGDLLPLYATRIHSIGVIGSDDQLQAVHERAAATAVIKGDAADVVIAFDGPTITVHDATRQASLAVWPGTPEGARGATDVIFGDANPSGRLPLTLPRYPFGFGLSYTTYEWSDLKIFPASPRYGQTVQVVVKVHNTGTRAGAEVVQVYVHQGLRGFVRVELKPGEAREVAVTLDRRSMSFYDPVVKDWAAEPGVFEVLVGTSSRDIRLKGSFELYR